MWIRPCFLLLFLIKKNLYPPPDVSNNVPRCAASIQRAVIRGPVVSPSRGENIVVPAVGRWVDVFHFFSYEPVEGPVYWTWAGTNVLDPDSLIPDADPGILADTRSWSRPTFFHGTMFKKFKTGKFVDIKSSYMCSLTPTKDVQALQTWNIFSFFPFLGENFGLPGFADPNESRSKTPAGSGAHN